MIQVVVACLVGVSFLVHQRLDVKTSDPTFLERGGVPKAKVNDVAGAFKIRGMEALVHEIILSPILNLQNMVDTKNTF